MNANGGAYLAHFQFDVYCGDLQGEIQTSFVEDTWIEIYPPFVNADDEAALRQIELESIPWRPGTLAPNYNRVRVKHLAIASTLGQRANALRVDLRPDRGSEFASRIISQFIGLVRWWTGQWWIGHDRRANIGLVRNHFEINEVGERLSGISTMFPIYGGFGIEHPFDLERFRNVRGNITPGRVIPLSFDALFDAIYYHVTKQVRRAVLDASIACEARIGEEAKRIADRDGISKSKLKRALASNDFTSQLEKGIVELTGRTFSQELSAEYRDLKALRDLRGNVAHGGPAVFAAAEGPREVKHEDLAQMLQSAVAMFKWLAEL